MGDREARLIDVHFEERYWCPDDGGEIWISGYQLVDGDRFLGRDAPELAERGLRVANVARAGPPHPPPPGAQGGAPPAPRGPRGRPPPAGRWSAAAPRPPRTTRTRSWCSRAASRPAGCRASWPP